MSRYAKASANEEKAHLDNLFHTLSEDKIYEGIIIFKFDKKTSINRKIKRLREIIKWTKLRKFDVNRISFMISEEDSEYTTLLVLQESSKFYKGLNKDYKLVRAEEFE